MRDSAPPGSAPWRQNRLQGLLAFAARSALDDGGFGWLDDHGRVDRSRPPELWINARMTYVFSLGSLAVDAAYGELARRGVEAIDTLFRDRRHGGWRSRLGDAAADETRSCYDHAFVVLAASAASEAGVGGARALLDEALLVHDRFWDASVGACIDTLTPDGKPVEDFRGANANMHTVEAWLTAATTTGDSGWLIRAARIGDLVIDRVARDHHWRVVEHFDADWGPRPDWNRHRPDDPFRPYGATPGHALEWSRLLLQLDAALVGDHPRAVGDAHQLFDQAVADAVGGHPALPYTTDWSGHPVTGERVHWVMAEAVMAAEARLRGAIEPTIAALRTRWWNEIDHYFVADDGSWRHELSPSMNPSSRIWSGRPDAYHATNALLFPDLPLGISAARALRDRRALS